MYTDEIGYRYLSSNLIFTGSKQLTQVMQSVSYAFLLFTHSLNPFLHCYFYVPLIINRLPNYPRNVNSSTGLQSVRGVCLAQRHGSKPNGYNNYCKRS